MPRRNRNRPLAYTPGRLIRLEEELHAIWERRQTSHRFNNLRNNLLKGNR